MGYEFDDRVIGKGKCLELLKLANEVQKKNTSVIGRLGEHFKVKLGLPSEYVQHKLDFREPFVCIEVGNMHNDYHILFHYCQELVQAKDFKLINLFIKELKLIKKDIEILKKDKMPYELEEKICCLN